MLFSKLPANVQALARKNHKLWAQNPSHPSLHFKEINAKDSIYSIRVGKGYRALGVRDGNNIVWFWIGSHTEYDKMIAGK